MTDQVLDIRNLTLRFDTARVPVQALRRISLTVPSGEIGVIVCDTRSGNATLAPAVNVVLS